jgi:hypothetical protein
VAIINSEHLLQQAEALIATTAGAPRQADLRRAVSAAYYAVFHAVLTAIADQFVGVGRRNNPEYALAYRQVEHGAFKRLCDDVRKPTLPDRYQAFAPTGSFSADLRVFATAVVDLQQKRHEADYDPLTSFSTSDVRAFVATGRDAIARLQRVGADERLIFLCLAAFPLRGAR